MEPVELMSDTDLMVQLPQSIREGGAGELILLEEVATEEDYLKYRICFTPTTDRTLEDIPGRATKTRCRFYCIIFAVLPELCLV